MIKVLVAGAGHGGLSAAAHLAEKGYSVDIYERNPREKMGYDWDDAIHNCTFEYAGINEYVKEDAIPRQSSAFYAPSMKTPIICEFDLDKTTLEIQRKKLYDYLILNAEKKGVKIHYQTNVEKAVYDFTTDKIKGLVVDGKEISGDLIIDSAGMYSPVRDSLPDSYKINKTFRAEEVFYVYRAIYNYIEDVPVTNPDKFNIYFLFNNVKGIAWYKIVEGNSDVLIGSVEPLSMEQIQESVKKLRLVQPSIGETLLKAGYVARIPLRAGFSLMVGNNYAAIGDAVSMVIPINGSGISNAILAGKLLAETVTNIDMGGKNGYNKERLWEYQVKYMKAVGAGLLATDIIKRCLLSYPAKVMDYFFDSGVLSSKDLGSGSSGEELTMSFAEILDKVKRGYKRLFMLIRLSNAVNASKKARTHVMNIPTVYNNNAVEAWIEKYESFIR